MPVSIDKQPLTLPWSAVAARGGRTADRACAGNSCTEQDLSAWRDAWVDYAGRLDELAGVAAQYGAGTPDQAVVLEAVNAARADAENAQQLDVSSQQNPMFRGSAITMWARAQARARFADAAATQLLAAYNVDAGVYAPGPAWHGTFAPPVKKRKKKGSVLPWVIGGTVLVGALVLSK